VFPIKRFKGFHRIDDDVLRGTSGTAADSSSLEDQLDLRRLCIRRRQSQRMMASEEILAMADDLCDLDGK
ncbi:hypothetical protein MTO96_033115, partial [Rhipicephalus appendiculatus]